MHIEQILEIRDDISQFIVHLTRDCNGRTAERNLLSILRNNTVKATNHHCLFSPLLDKLDDELQVRFFTVCFTETPLDKIYHLFNIDGRQIDLRPFGLVFTKETVIERGGNPCVYLNGDHNSAIEKYLKSLYRNSKKNEFEDYFYKLGAITNTFKKNHNFYWEREWRVIGNFPFRPEDIFAIISENQEIKVPNRYKGIPIINPKWRYEEMVSQLSIQLWNMKSK